MLVMPNLEKYKWFLHGKGSQIQINNETIIEFGSRRIWGIIKASIGLCYLPQSSASEDNTNLCLNNSSYPTRPHSIIECILSKFLWFTVGILKGKTLSLNECERNLSD